MRLLIRDRVLTLWQHPAGYTQRMLPIRHRSIFKSRWMALLWAAGIMWSAVEFVGAEPETDPPAGHADAASNALG